MEQTLLKNTLRELFSDFYEDPLPEMTRRQIEIPEVPRCATVDASHGERTLPWGVPIRFLFSAPFGPAITDVRNFSTSSITRGSFR